MRLDVIKRMALMVAVLCSTSLATDHHYVKNHTYDGYSFARSKLGIAFYPREPVYPQAQSVYENLSSGGSFPEFMKATVLYCLRENTAFLDIAFVSMDTLHGIRTLLDNDKRAHSFLVPDSLPKYLREYGISFLVLIEDPAYTCGSYDIPVRSRIQYYDPKTKMATDDKYVDSSVKVFHSFWYIVLEVSSGEAVQYGEVVYSDSVRRLLIKDLRKNIVSCWKDVVTDGPMYQPR